MGGGLESRCMGRVYGADGAVQAKTNYVQIYKFRIFSESCIKEDKSCKINKLRFFSESCIREDKLCTNI